ncbi:MAG: glycosyltransferase family 39 protein [Acetatifactor sp.]|nr:glycosyltransferase family 39 protein [Acetatifactor sp.]
MKLTVIKEKIEKWQSWLLALILAVAVLFRIVGADWGMPYGNLHPDEGLIYAQAYQNTLNHSFEVRDYYRPNHVTIKLNTLLYMGIQELYFAPQGQEDFALNYSEHFALFTTASRILIALFGVGTVVFAYLIARFLGRKQALFATSLFAVFPSFIEHSHYITPDIPLLFFLMGVLWAALCYQKKPTVSWLFWMSFFTALAFCEKYPGAYGCAMIAVAVIVKHYKEPFVIVKRGCQAIAFVGLGVLAVSPVLVIDYRTVLEVMAGQNKQYHLGADGLNFGETLLFYLKTTGVHAGLILTLSSLYGLWKAFRKEIGTAIILMSLFLYIVPISMLSIHWERYTLPLYAVVLLFGSHGAICLIEDISNLLKNNSIATWVACGLFFLLPLAGQLGGAVATTGRFLAPDSRIALQQTFADMGVTDANTVNDCNTPLDPGGFYGAFSEFDNADPATYKYGGNKRFVMTSSAQRDLFLTADPEVYGGVADFYRRLDENYPMIAYYPVEVPSAHFLEVSNMWYASRSIWRYMRGALTGYEIRVYQIRP